MPFFEYLAVALANLHVLMTSEGFAKKKQKKNKKKHDLVLILKVAYIRFTN